VGGEKPGVGQERLEERMHAKDLKGQGGYLVLSTKIMREEERRYKETWPK